MPKLWRIEIEWDELFWDRYEGFIVCAETEERALELVKAEELSRNKKRKPVSFSIEDASTLPEGIVLGDYSAG